MSLALPHTALSTNIGLLQMQVHAQSQRAGDAIETLCSSRGGAEWEPEGN